MERAARLVGLAVPNASSRADLMCKIYGDSFEELDDSSQPKTSPCTRCAINFPRLCSTALLLSSIGIGTPVQSFL